ncbi:hypothetical protein PG994_014092 [Apiospora phragmitis]|uniref:Ankyrin repeat-containing domain protein n=1 Tax=Apiospora phragmitis TaxID=2905665 RepID=A0ABR1T399_9PEZI
MLSDRTLSTSSATCRKKLIFLGGAPPAVSLLFTLGAELEWDVGQCPDIAILCITLAMIHDSSQREKNAALTIACTSNGLELYISDLQSRASTAECNEDGYLPLYAALCQGHDETTYWLFRRITGGYGGPNNPIVDFSQGRTSVHEVLWIVCPESEADMVETLKLLAKYRADPDIITSESLTPRQQAALHLSPEVQQVFNNWIKYKDESVCTLDWTTARRRPVYRGHE